MNMEFNGFEQSTMPTSIDNTQESELPMSPSDSVSEGVEAVPKPPLAVRLMQRFGICPNCIIAMLNDLGFYMTKLACLSFAISIGVASGMHGQQPPTIYVNESPKPAVAAKPCGCGQNVGQTPTLLPGAVPANEPLIKTVSIPVEAVFRKH